jgi:hypothetical protein
MHMTVEHREETDQSHGRQLRQAEPKGIDPALMHRLTTISAGTLDALSSQWHCPASASNQQTDSPRKLFDMVMTVIVGVIISLLAVIALGSAFGSF